MGKIGNLPNIFESIVLKVGGGTKNNVKTVVSSIEHCYGQGFISRDEYRRISEYIPGAMRMGAEALGVTTGEFREMLSTGKVRADTLLPKLAERLETFAESVGE